MAQENCELPISDYHSKFALGVRARGLGPEAQRPAQEDGLENRAHRTFRPRPQVFEQRTEVRAPESVAGIRTRSAHSSSEANNLRTPSFWWHERINVDGYVEMSIAETNPYTGYERRYVHKHVHLWEASNGPVPKDHCLKCVDGRP